MGERGRREIKSRFRRVRDHHSEATGLSAVSGFNGTGLNHDVRWEATTCGSERSSPHMYLFGSPYSRARSRVGAGAMRGQEAGGRVDELVPK